MKTLALFGLAALAFSVLAGALEWSLARRARRRLIHRKALPVLHPLTHHGVRRVRDSRSRRVLHHLWLFVGFLFVTYFGLLFLRAVHNLVAGWF